VRDEERRPIVTSELEAWQPVGITTRNDEEIKQLGSYSLMPEAETQLWNSWTPSDHDSRVWSNQNFTLYLAFLVTQERSRQTNLPAFRILHGALSLKQHGRLSTIIIQRHLTGTGAIVALGSTIGPVGPFAGWSYYGYGLYEGSSASNSAGAKFMKLC